MADGTETNALREEVRAWLAEHWKGLPTGRSGAGWTQPPEVKAWLAKVVEARWAVPRWPVEWHGRALPDAQARVIEREFAAVGAPGAGQDRTNLWANTLLACGTEGLKQKLIKPLLCQEVGMCLLYSEPGAGSDLAGVRTKAEKVGDHFVVNGQKVWTSGAAAADYGMLIARTDFDVPKHKGISFFFLPMKQPGVEVRPLRQITDESHFNEVFITDAIVPEENLLKGLGEGWGVLQTALAYERSVMGEGARGARSGAPESKTEEPLIALAREAGRLSDPLLRQELAQAIAYRRLNALNTARAKADLAQGTSSPVMSLGKLAMSRILHGEARVRTAILGAGSLLEGPDHPRAEDANFLALNAYFTSIGGGTDQIQRNIIGERVLGLPKEPEVDRDIPFRQVKSGR
jgi:alkylation response protein AidB-like acyl-CoA dehydrogenase